jgi:hypothetical protein
VQRQHAQQEGLENEGLPAAPVGMRSDPHANR